MKERTLLHLLLATGRQLAITSLSDTQLAQVIEVLDSLTVSKERGQPFRIEYISFGQTNVIVRPADTFNFHLRGDILSRVEQRPETLDLRTSNQAAALEIWGEILGSDVTPAAQHRVPSRSSAWSQIRSSAILPWAF